jgi:outer membrane lipoprotein
MGRVSFLLTIVFFVTGCGHAIQKDVLREVNTEITFIELHKDPMAYQGKKILLGGVIVKTVNKENGTLLEIYQTEINGMGRPVHLDISGGRFVALYKGFLDKEIYQKGRKVTMVGIVKGKKMIRVGEMDYKCPYLVVKDIHLWEKEQPSQYVPYPYVPWYIWWHDPWRPYHPTHPR